VRRLAFVAAIAVVSCGFDDPKPEDVLRVVAVTDDAGPCTADKTCQATARVCLISKTPAANVQAQVHLSAGSWLVPTSSSDPATASINLGGGCTGAGFRVGTTVAPIVVQASVGNYTVSTSLPVVAAPASDISLVSTPLAIPVDAGAAGAALSLKVVVLAAPPSSSLSDGTRVELSIAQVVPLGHEAIIAPDFATLDSAASAIASVALDPTVTSVTVHVRVLGADGRLLLEKSFTLLTIAG
jgi:hypothetical protein